MNKSHLINTFAVATIVCLSVLSCFSCSNDDDAPVIESVWRNMTSEPIAQVTYAYPGQTLRLQGHGFSGLKRIVVNDSPIDVTNTLIYDTDQSVTFKLPNDVNTSTEANRYYIKVETANGDTTYQPFHVKPTSEKPAITQFSSIILVAGSLLTITGSNLDGATDVYLPTVFDRQTRCEFADGIPNTATEVNVVVPADVHFAKGQVEVVMQKTDPILGKTYEERVYSSVTNFQ